MKPRLCHLLLEVEGRLLSVIIAEDQVQRMDTPEIVLPPTVPPRLPWQIGQAVVVPLRVIKIAGIRTLDEFQDYRKQHGISDIAECETVEEAVGVVVGNHPSIPECVTVYAAGIEQVFPPLKIRLAAKPGQA
jgi:hypothetical protein